MLPFHPRGPVRPRPSRRGTFVTDDADAARPRRPPRRTRRKERPAEPLPEAVPEPWQEALPATDEVPAETLAPAPAEDVAAVATTTATLTVLDGRSPQATICPFLRAVGPNDAVGFPVEAPDVSNRCAALHETVPQSLRQQELVCLTRAHVDCPRYLRGAVVANEVTDASVRSRTQLTPAIAASLIILGLSFAASVAFGLANGGLLLPSPPASVGPGASVAVIVPSPSVEPSSPVVSRAPSAEPTPAATTEPSLTPEPSATPVASETPSVSVEPSVKPSATPKPSSDRYDLLTACPNKPKCYIYKIHSGDNLFSIAKYFGVPLATVKKLNPWTKTQSLRAGKELILPPPTR